MSVPWLVFLFICIFLAVSLLLNSDPDPGDQNCLWIHPAPDPKHFPNTYGTPYTERVPLASAHASQTWDIF